ncbi:MAG: hypothetical protein EXS55_03365, partial [Candidatus Magasanikbacteria bacterium]|nr:hypothetical protein [Candidatus Magasanikbacteria bacterium]
ATDTFRDLILDTWQFRHVRLAAHWDSVEPKRAEYDFTELDKLMAFAAEHRVKIVLAVGQKTPRWPECHLPAWTKELSPEQFKTARLNYVSAVVKRYKNYSALEMWQVENEPFLPFGECPSFTEADLKAELSAVKQIDNIHPILVTDSGELSTWRRTANAGDFFGTTMYRTVWNKYLGYVNYDWLPAAFYRFKLWVVNRSPESAFVVELQAEPWIPDQTITTTPLAEQNKSLDLNRLQKNIDYAYRVGLSRSYLWGAEWWAWLAKNGHTEIADYIQKLPKGE